MHLSVIWICAQENMKKKILTLFMGLVMVLALASCSNSSPTTQPLPDNDAQEPEQSNASVITDMEAGEAEVYEVIVPWTFQDGDPVDNPYYKKGTDEDGNPVYMVEKANGQVSYLPMGETVVYASENESSHFERTTYTYKEDGEEKAFTQYQLYVNTLSPDNDDEVRDVVSEGDITSDLVQRGDGELDASTLPDSLDETIACL